MLYTMLPITTYAPVGGLRPPNPHFQSAFGLQKYTFIKKIIFLVEDSRRRQRRKEAPYFL